MIRRTELVARLRSQSFDLLIVGGGIVGAGLARDAAMRGLRVALIEQGDFAGGTSSKTSKLIHGGLRYLEYGRFRLVRESVRERDTLRTIAPELVWPISLSLPIYRGDPRPPWKVAAGLTLYDLLAMRWHFNGRRMLSPSQARLREPALSPRDLQAVGSYTDCQMDDARLCLMNVLQAVAFGAVCCNYVRLVEFHKASGVIVGATIEDLRERQMIGLSATVVVNATGPWADAVRRLSDPAAPRRLAPTKGVHVVVPRVSAGALFLQARADRRMLFVLPWGDYSLIGTTESDDVDRLDALAATPGDVDYLFTEVNRVLPEASLRPEHIVASFAGARPLLAFDGSSTGASREHRLEIDRFGLVSIMGGKYTTYRLMAQQTLDAVLRHRTLRAEPCLTDQVSLLESTHPVALNRWQEVTRGIAPELLARLLTTYGTGAFRLLQLLEFEPSLIQPVCPHHDVIQAELVYAIQAELACTVSDVLVRRTKIAFSSCQGLDMLSTLTDVLQRYGRLSPEAIDDQLADYHRFLGQSLACRGTTRGFHEAYETSRV